MLILNNQLLRIFMLSFLIFTYHDKINNQIIRALIRKNKKSISYYHSHIFIYFYKFIIKYTYILFK